MNYPALFFWVLLVWSVTTSPGTLLVLVFASMSFASLALVPPDMVGGMSILPQLMFAAILTLKVITPKLLPPSPILTDALRFRNLGNLALFLVIGLVATVIAPRLFLGEVVVMPMRLSSAPDVLGPVMSNITQSGYVTLSVMTVFAVTLMADEERFEDVLLRGVLAGGIVCIATGLVDLAASFTGMESLLEPFRNAGYAYITTAELGGVRRVVGLTPEASAYGPICVQFATAASLLRPLYAEGRQRLLATLVTIGLLGMALLSTSSTAYAGLAVLGLVYTGNWIRRAVFPTPLGQNGLLGELMVGLGLLIAFVSILVISAGVFDPLLNLVQEVIFNKPTSSSFFERSHWNEVASNAVTSTWGLGVGFGSTRASSWFVAVISNTGVIGAAFMAIFLLQTFLRRATSPTQLSSELLPALKLSLLPSLAMASFNEPGPDFGLWTAVVFGAITGIAAIRPRRSSVKLFTPGTSLTSPRAGHRTVGYRAFGGQAFRHR
jgi:hypothetical protein